MTKKLLKNLTLASFKNSELNKETVIKITSRLKRSELKLYIRSLKYMLRKNTVTVISPISLTRELKNEYINHYKGKRLDFVTNSDVLLGVKIINNDLVFDTTLRKSFSTITESMKA